MLAPDIYSNEKLDLHLQVNSRSAILCIAILFASTAAAAQNASSAVSVELGTTGVGAHFAVPIRDNIGARFGVGYLTYNYSDSTTDLRYDFKLKLQVFDALLDFYPISGSGFRITGGAVINGNRLTATGKPTATGTYTVNGTTYSAANAGNIDGKIDFRSVAPYLGIGWGNAPASGRGWGFTSDFGVIFQGSPRTNLTNTNCTAPASVCAQLASDVAAENQELKDEADKFKAYPVIRFGANYRF